MNESWLHPCLRCGACCAAYRVSFYWGELAPESTPAAPFAAVPAPEQGDAPAVPPDLTEQVHPFRAAMRTVEVPGLPGKPCIALCGTIGERAHCGIYTARPSPCRDLPASYSPIHSPETTPPSGTPVQHQGPEDKCDRARQKFGLAPLTLADWLQATPDR
jgi:Fe-S-cluster containining protein